MNLHKLGKKYRPGWDEARMGRERDPWLMQLKGRKGRGHVYQHGRDLGVATTRRVGQKILDLVEGARILQDGDDGMNLAFPVSQLDLVAEILPLRKRRVLSDEQKAVLSARMSANRKVV